MVFGPKSCFDQFRILRFPLITVGNCMVGWLARHGWWCKQASLNFGEEQTMVNLRARPSYCTNKVFYTERMKNEREKMLWRRNHHGADG
jgi:hypothetical protein